MNEKSELQELLPDSLVNKLKKLENLHQRNPKQARFLTFALFTGAFIYFISIILQPFQLSGKIYAITFASIILVFAFVCRTIIRHLFPPEVLPKGEYFEPIGQIIKSPLKRELEIKTLIQKMESNLPTRLFVISGASGAGKSTLIHQLLVPKLRDQGWIIPEVISGFSNSLHFKQTIRKRLDKAGLQLDLSQGIFNQRPRLVHPDESQGDNKKSILVVFDQFEQFLDQIDTEPQLSTWFKHLILEFLMAANIRCLLIVRKEYYYSLRIFSDSLDVFKNTIHIPGISFKGDEQDDDAIKATEKLRQVVKKEAIYKEIEKELKQSNEILPLEIQMVGFMLEDLLKSPKRFHKTGKDFYNQEIRGKRGLIYRYFIRYIDSTRDKDTAKAVLYALSTGTMLRKKCDLDELVKVCHRDAHSIEKVMLPLEEGGLVIKTDEKYSLAHDYLAEEYHDLSGSLLDPVDRDNITYFSDLLKRKDDRQDDLFEKITTIPKSGFLSKVNVVFYFLYLLFTIRLLSPVFNLNWSWIDVYIKSATSGLFQTSSVPFDIDYLPSFIASCISAWYVWRIHQNFILNMSDRKFLGYFNIAFSFIMMVSGAIIPHFWLLFASFAGWLIAFRIGLSYWGVGISWIKRKIDILNRAANYTFLYMTFATSIGLFLGYIFYFWPNRMTYAETIAIGEIAFSLLFFFFMVQCSKTHATKYKGALFLSTWDRLRLSV